MRDTDVHENQLQQRSTCHRTTYVPSALPSTGCAMRPIHDQSLTLFTSISAICHPY